MILIPFIFVVLLIPMIKKIAIKINAVDVPGGRHIHKKTTPKLGGLAIFFGFLLGYMIFGTHSSIMNGILIGSFIIILIGVIDDITELGALPQFIGQLASACVVVFYGGLLIKDVNAFGLYIDFSILSYPLTIFFIVGCINCINLIDGLDGLSGGISSIYYLTIGIIAIIQGKTGLDFVLAFTMLGSTLGFLVYNFNPASIFAGDCGSNFMGFMIAVIALLGFKNVTMTSFIIPLIILAIPILDTLFALIRRFLKKQPLFEGDKFHLHHQFLNRNFTTKQTVLIIYVIDALFAFASILYFLNDKEVGYVIYSILLILVVIFVLKTNIVFDRELIKQKFKKSK
ncbi:MAG: undecaprenyl/decaprenyl-phosphate alpha-N-acetylglucosaminyl 1-phosphate transferase [Lactobacillales bacterium]|nr:undecaprenyl/decaprenyl-phosphate alpha-N-acetylglucosaminyl 1-phosphate transferase [Lactobacillales bacterium]